MVAAAKTKIRHPLFFQKVSRGPARRGVWSEWNLREALNAQHYFKKKDDQGREVFNREAFLAYARGAIDEAKRKLTKQASDAASRAGLAGECDVEGLLRLVGIGGVDTRRLTRRLRDFGAVNGVIRHEPSGEIDVARLKAEATACPSMEGLDLAKEVTCLQTYEWDETCWVPETGYGRLAQSRRHVVAIDYGAKRNILRCLASAGCRVTVVPAATRARDVLARKPDGIFLSNGPGDPAATGAYAVPVIRELVESGIPVFGICLGHQMLALALGARTEKMHHGHRGANHPVKELATGKVEITCQNHGFVVTGSDLPTGVVATHVSLFDGTLEGLKVEGRPVFSVQYHPEASPGPQDSRYLFERFVSLMDEHA
ncbi:MAG: glutamine-hydrolyzing carbamoyl-phosphate synthase small subunit [Nitrospinota bacterium]